MNEQTGIARRTEAPRSSAVLDACGACHTRRKVIAEGNTPATRLLDRSMPALLEPGLYHADGQIDGEVFEVGSFMQSKMFAAGVTCTNCHDPHTGGLRASGNGLCAQCHAPPKFDVTEHHHHAPGGSGAQCVACHMPAKTYMGVDLRRDHSFRVPRPDLTETIGVPNTCNACHTEQLAGVGGNHCCRLVSARQTSHTALRRRAACRTRGAIRCGGAVGRVDPGSDCTGDGASKRPAFAGAPRHAGIRDGDQDGDRRSECLGSNGGAPCPAG